MARCICQLRLAIPINRGFQEGMQSQRACKAPQLLHDDFKIKTSDTAWFGREHILRAGLNGLLRAC